MAFHDASADEELRFDGAMLIAELLHDLHLIRTFFFKIEGDDG